jgi:hypothetical protein
MKEYFLFFACFSSLLGFSVDYLDEGKATSEESQISLLVEATKKSYLSLQNLQKCFAEFKEQESQCLKKPNDAEALFSLSSKAFSLLKSIKENNVEPYFRPSFIEELEKIAKPAESKTIPPILIQ